MSLAEARKKFPVGSRVRVVDSGECYSSYDSWARLYLAPDDYNDWDRIGIYLDDGDIGEVIRIGEHSDGFGNIAAIRVPDKKVFLIGIDGIESYDPTSEDAEMPGDVPFDVACQKALELEKAGYKSGFDGTCLIVEAYGRRVARDMTELLDELVSECYKESQLIREGDKVRILNLEYTFPFYTKWAERHMCFEQACCWQYSRYPKDGWLGRVLFVRDHLEFKCKIAAVEMIDKEDESDGSIYLIDVNGLKKVEEEEHV